VRTPLSDLRPTTDSVGSTPSLRQLLRASFIGSIASANALRRYPIDVPRVVSSSGPCTQTIKHAYDVRRVPCADAACGRDGGATYRLA